MLAVEHLVLVERREVPGTVDHHRGLAVDELGRHGWSLAPVEAVLGRRTVVDELLPQAQRLYSRRRRDVLERGLAPVAPEERLPLPGGVLSGLTGQPDPVMIRSRQSLGGAHQLRPRLWRADVCRLQHGDVVDQCDRVGACDWQAVVLAVGQAFIDHSRVIPLGAETLQTAQWDNLACRDHGRYERVVDCQQVGQVMTRSLRQEFRVQIGKGYVLPFDRHARVSGLELLAVGGQRGDLARRIEVVLLCERDLGRSGTGRLRQRQHQHSARRDGEGCQPQVPPSNRQIHSGSLLLVSMAENEVDRDSLTTRRNQGSSSLIRLPPPRCCKSWIFAHR